MIAIVDYGAGNIFSVDNALKFLNQPYILANTEKELEQCDKIILPGVGAFRDVADMLKSKKLFSPLQKLGKIKPLLGICLGMQLLFEKGYEFGESEGLGLIKGSVELMDVPYKIPHMGWNSLVYDNIDCPLFVGVKQNAYVYFVHSYAAITDKKYIAAHCDYGKPITAVVQNGNVFGTQFHPEKSGEQGLKILSNFCSL